MGSRTFRPQEFAAKWRHSIVVVPAHVCARSSCLILRTKFYFVALYGIQTSLQCDVLSFLHPLRSTYTGVVGVYFGTCVFLYVSKHATKTWALLPSGRRKGWKKSAKRNERRTTTSRERGKKLITGRGKPGKTRKKEKPGPVRPRPRPRPRRAEKKMSCVAVFVGSSSSQFSDTFCMGMAFTIRATLGGSSWESVAFSGYCTR